MLLYYLVRNVNDRADVASTLLSSHRGRQDGHTHKYCSQSTLPVENNSGNQRGVNEGYICAKAPRAMRAGQNYTPIHTCRKQ